MGTLLYSCYFYQGWERTEDPNRFITTVLRLVRRRYVGHFEINEGDRSRWRDGHFMIMH